MYKRDQFNAIKHRLVNNKNDTIEDEERAKIRAELSTMSFVELQKLKEEMGSKLYNETIFGKRKNNKRPQIDFKRENKNRPREMPAKKQVPLLRNIPKAKQFESRDPRFDPRVGEFNEKAFRTSYSFLEDVRLQELDSLKKELKECPDADHAENLKYVITRIENQILEKKKLEEKKQKKIAENLERLEEVKQGNKPVYRKKSEKRILDLVEKYEELKKTGRVEKHIMKRGKKKAQKDRKVMLRSGFEHSVKHGYNS